MKSRNKLWLIAIIAIMAFGFIACDLDNNNAVVTAGVERLTWFEYNGEITITGLTEGAPVAVLNIPEQINGIPVTTIGERAFFSNFDNTRGTLISVTIPNSITSIGNQAFLFNQLTSVTIPDSVTFIGHGAFASNYLTNVTIGNSVTSIGGNAFAHNRLTSITIPDSVILISLQAFAHNRLTSVTIGNSVTSIASRAFENNQLTSITIGAGVNVNNNAFNQGSGLGTPSGFVAAYYATGRLAGRYTRPNTASFTWTRQ